MTLQINETEIALLQTSITAKIKRCRGSINNFRTHPEHESAERMIPIRERQILELTELREKLEIYELEETEVGN